jgi:predicted transcriptional regulator
MAAQLKKPVNRVNKDEAVRLKTENKLTYKEIATLQGVSPVAVYKSIKDLLPNDETKIYQDNKIGILDNLQKRLIQSISDEDIQNMSTKDKITGVAILIDKANLLNGHTKGLTNFGTIVIMPGSAPAQDWMNNAKQLLNAPKQAEIVDVSNDD